MVLITPWLSCLFTALCLWFFFHWLQFLLPISPFLEEQQRYRSNMTQGHKRSCIHGIGSLLLKPSVAQAHKKALLDVQFASVILPCNCSGCLIPSWHRTWKDHKMPNTTTCFCLHSASYLIYSHHLIFASIVECFSKLWILKHVSKNESELYWSPVST